jgi:hypothetical protein
MSLTLLGISGKIPFKLDPDVKAWSQASSITDPYWLIPLDVAVKDLKANNIWSKIVYCNPVAGATPLSVSIPLKHPLGLPSLIYGNPSITNLGITGDGVGTYINTQMNSDPYIPSIYDQHHLCYQNLSSGYNTTNSFGRVFGGYGVGQNSGSDGGINVGFCYAGSEVNGFGDCPYNTSPLTRMNVNLTGGKKWNGTVAVSRTAANNAVVYIKGVVEFTETDNLLLRSPNLSYNLVSNNRTGLWQRPFFWMAPNNVSNVNWDSGIRAQLDTRYVSTGRFAWFSNGAGLTNSELAVYDSILTTLQTTWGRNA